MPSVYRPFFIGRMLKGRSRRKQLRLVSILKISSADSGHARTVLLKMGFKLEDLDEICAILDNSDFESGGFLTNRKVVAEAVRLTIEEKERVASV